MQRLLTYNKDRRKEERRRSSIKLFKFYRDESDWGEYNGIVILAEDEKQVAAILASKYSYIPDYGNWKIQEVDTSKPGVVLMSFAADVQP